MKVEIGSVYRCTRIKDFMVRVLGKDEKGNILGECVNNPNYYENGAIGFWDGRPCGRWTLDSFLYAYTPVVSPSEIWKELNE
jgi:hypothetical protein